MSLNFEWESVNHKNSKKFENKLKKHGDCKDVSEEVLGVKVGDKALAEFDFGVECWNNVKVKTRYLWYSTAHLEI